jgi:hypothetical protein
MVTYTQRTAVVFWHLPRCGIFPAVSPRRHALKRPFMHFAGLNSLRTLIERRFTPRAVTPRAVDGTARVCTTLKICHWQPPCLSLRQRSSNFTNFVECEFRCEFCEFDAGLRPLVSVVVPPGSPFTVKSSNKPLPVSSADLRGSAFTGLPVDRYPATNPASSNPRRLLNFEWRI